VQANEVRIKVSGEAKGGHQGSRQHQSDNGDGHVPCFCLQS